jgi:hypothetical protein
MVAQINYIMVLILYHTTAYLETNNFSARNVRKNCGQQEGWQNSIR